MFHFPAFPPRTLYIQVRVTRYEPSRVSPFGHPRITARLPAPRGLSQAPTSFIGSWCQGIHRMPLQTYTYPQLDNHPENRAAIRRTLKDARVHYTVLKQPPAPTPHPAPTRNHARRSTEGPTHEETTTPRRPTDGQACSLRTQQRATTPRTPGHHVPHQGRPWPY